MLPGQAALSQAGAANPALNPGCSWPADVYTGPIDLGGDQPPQHAQADPALRGFVIRMAVAACEARAEARSTVRLEPGQIEVIDDELAAVLQRDADGRAFGDRRPAVLLRTANDRRYAACRASGLGRTARWPRGRATNPDAIG